MTPARIKAYFYLTLVALIWGIATPVIKYTLGGISPLPFLTYRFAISGVIGGIFLLFTARHLKTIFTNFLEVVLYGFLTTTFALGILFFGIEKTTVLDTALISAVGPLLTALAGVVFLKETITAREKLGIAVAFSGTLVTVFEPIFNGGLGSIQITGNFLVVGYLVVMAFSSILAKKLVRKDVDPLALTNVAFIVGFLTLLPFSLKQASASQLTNQIVSLSPNFQLGVWYMAAISGTLGYALWIRGQKTIEVSEAGVFNYLIPIFAAPLGVVWLGEKITPVFILGATLITIGVVIAEWKKRRKRS